MIPTFATAMLQHLYYTPRGFQHGLNRHFRLPVLLIVAYWLLRRFTPQHESSANASCLVSVQRT